MTEEHPPPAVAADPPPPDGALAAPPEPAPAPPEPQEDAVVAPPRWRRLLLATLPHLLTAAIAIGLTLAIVRAMPQPQRTIIPPVRPTTVPTTPAPTAPAPTASGPQPQPDERVLRQEILDLQVSIDDLWSSLYIARAAGQIADAEAALRINDTSEVERVLVAVDASLALAYERSGDLNKGPISEFRIQVGQVRDDLYVRPEGLDQKLRLLRQRMLSLVEEP